MSQAIFSVFILSFCLTSIFRHSSFIMCLIFFKCMSITNVYQNSSLLSYYDYGQSLAIFGYNSHDTIR